MPGTWQTAERSQLAESLPGRARNESAAAVAALESQKAAHFDDFVVLDSESGAFAFFGWRNLVVVVWARQATGAAVARLTTVVDPIAAAHPEGYSAVHLIQGGAGMPTDEARAAFIEQMTRYASTLACVSVVLLGKGFWASALHTVIVGMQSLQKRPFSVDVFGHVDNVTASLPAEHLKRTGVALDPKVLGEHLRRALTEVTGEATQRPPTSRPNRESTRGAFESGPRRPS